MIPRRRFFVRLGSTSHEVVWRLDPRSGTYHAVRPRNGTVTACGKKSKLINPPGTVSDPSDCSDTCLACAEAVIRIVDQPKPIDLKIAILKARAALN